MSKWQAFLDKLDPEVIMVTLIQAVLTSISLGLVHIPNENAQLISIAGQALLQSVFHVSQNMGGSAKPALATPAVLPASPPPPPAPPAAPPNP